VRTTESAALAVLRKIHARVPRGDLSAMKVSLPPDVAIYLLNNKREDLAGLEHRYKTRIGIVPVPTLRPHQSEIELVSREGSAAPMEEPAPPARAREAREPAPSRERAREGKRGAHPEEGRAGETATPSATGEGKHSAETAASAQEGEGGGRRRRRRRRRRSRHGRGERPETSAAAPDSFPTSGESPAGEEPLVVRAEALPDEEIKLPERLPEPASESSPPAAEPTEAKGAEEGKAVKKVRRLWWRKRAGRTRAAAGGDSSGGSGESS
jgi:ribonuclease E